MSSCAPPPPPPLQGLLESMINDKNKIVRLKITKTECTGHPAIDVRSFKSSGPLATSCRKACSNGRKCEEHIVKHRTESSDDKNAVIKRKLEALFSSNIIEEKSKINCINVASYDESTNTAIQVTPARSLPNRESLSNSPKTMKGTPYDQSRHTSICKFASNEIQLSPNSYRPSIIEPKKDFANVKLSSEHSVTSPVLSWSGTANKIEVLSLNDSKRRIASLENRVSVNSLHCEVDIGCSSGPKCTDTLSECRLTPIVITPKITRSYCAVTKNGDNSKNVSSSSDLESRFHFKEVLVSP